MDYIREYKSFINSHNLTGAVRITAGIIVSGDPAGLFQQPVGRALPSLSGRCCVGNTDNPGPIHHRRKRYVWRAIVIIFIASILTGLVYGLGGG